MAHRGWSGKAPENTLAAIRLALSHPGIQAIEMDVQLTKDGVPVLFHDFYLDRTTNGTGRLVDQDYDKLLRLDAGSWFDSSFVNEKIPTLESVFQLVGDRRMMNVELKRGSAGQPGLEKRVVQLIHQYGLESSVFVTSFHHQLIKNVRSFSDDIRTGLIVEGRPLLIHEQLKEAGASILSMSYAYLTKDFVSDMIDSGVSMVAWTVDRPSEIERVMVLHPELQIATNHPDRMITLLGKN
ncbi:glycerophosphodiester phosphodiesterase [Ammoniphilus resinae]